MSEEKDFIKRLEHLVAKLDVDREIYIMDCLKKDKKYPDQSETNKHVYKKFIGYLAKDFGVKF